MKLSIIIPAYNEARTIHLILNKIKEVELAGGFEKEVIIVNDCSKDGTEEAISTGNTRLTRGKGRPFIPVSGRPAAIIS
jgi:glycosyltransferase involved in cell wall biosynthesis